MQTPRMELVTDRSALREWVGHHVRYRRGDLSLPALLARFGLGSCYEVYRLERVEVRSESATRYRLHYPLEGLWTGGMSDTRYLVQSEPPQVDMMRLDLVLAIEELSDLAAQLERESDLALLSYRLQVSDALARLRQRLERWPRVAPPRSAGQEINEEGR